MAYESLIKLKRGLQKTKLYLFVVYKIYSARFIYIYSTAVVAQSIRALAQQAYGWAFESQPRQTLIKVVKTGSDSFIAKRSAIGVTNKQTNIYICLIFFF